MNDQLPPKDGSPASWAMLSTTLVNNIASLARSSDSTDVHNWIESLSVRALGHFMRKEYVTAAELASEASAATWARLHDGPWRKVTPESRNAYALATTVLAVSQWNHRLATNSNFSVDNPTETNDSQSALDVGLAEVVRQLDMVLLLSGDPTYSLGPFVQRLHDGFTQPNVPKRQEEARTRTHKQQHGPQGEEQTHILQDGNTDGKSSKRPRTTMTPEEVSPVDKGCAYYSTPIQRIDTPSLRWFKQNAMIPGQPVIITSAMTHWKAMSDPKHDWKDTSYLRRVAGHRTVPVELGKSYMDNDWAQSLTTLGTFLDKHITHKQQQQQQQQQQCSAGASDKILIEIGSSEQVTDAALPKGYLAQHRLFDQVPALRADIAVPDYCVLSLSKSLKTAGSVTTSSATTSSSSNASIDSGGDGGNGNISAGGNGASAVGKGRVLFDNGNINAGNGNSVGGNDDIDCDGDGNTTASHVGVSSSSHADEQEKEEEEEEDGEPEINAWFGPSGTVSNLHFDLKHNLLCQVIGTKVIRLYHPRHSATLYPHEGMMSNTSQVTVEGTAEHQAQFKGFDETPFLECTLQRGEMLYIPPRHWHYIRSTSVSFSVSFWWK